MHILLQGLPTKQQKQYLVVDEVASVFGRDGEDVIIFESWFVAVVVTACTAWEVAAWTVETAAVVTGGAAVGAGWVLIAVGLVLGSDLTVVNNGDAPEMERISYPLSNNLF